MEVILNTGRPAGYGATLLAYLPMVSAVIVENGGAWLDVYKRQVRKSGLCDFLRSGGIEVRTRSGLCVGLLCGGSETGQLAVCL